MTITEIILSIGVWNLLGYFAGGFIVGVVLSWLLIQLLSVRRLG